MRLNKKRYIFLSLALCVGIIGCGTSINALEKAKIVQQEVEDLNNEVTHEIEVKEVATKSNITLLELEGGMQTINVVELAEQGSNVRKFRLEAQIGGEWQSIYTNDLIEGYHLCALASPVTTDAIRLVVEEEASPVTITQMSARYLEPIERTAPFTNTAYVSSTYFEHNWDYIHPDNFRSLTDIIMIGNFCFNTKGELVIIEHEPEGGGGTPHAWDSEYTKSTFPAWQENVTKYTDANVWVSITCFKGSPNGAEGGRTDVFRDANVRQAFLENLVEFAKLYNIAGYDIDWEYPGTSSQWADYNNLILEASELFKANGLMLSSAQATGSGLNQKSLNALDRINVMSYDNYGTTKNHSTFYNSAVKIIKEFKNKGVDTNKIILGLPYYGVKVDSYYDQWDYRHIYDQMIAANDFDPGINIYNKWGFNGVNLIRDKVVYAIEQELGGVFCWQMKNDIRDFDSNHSLAGTTSEAINDFVAK